MRLDDYVREALFIEADLTMEEGFASADKFNLRGEYLMSVQTDKLIASRKNSIERIRSQIADYEAEIVKVGDSNARGALQAIARAWHARAQKLQDEVEALEALQKVQRQKASK